jgi:hypothetical protein
MPTKLTITATIREITLDGEVSHYIIALPKIGRVVCCVYGEDCVTLPGGISDCPLCGDDLTPPDEEEAPGMTRAEWEEEQRFEHGDQRCDEMRGT